MAALEVAYVLLEEIGVAALADLFLEEVGVTALVVTGLFLEEVGMATMEAVGFFFDEMGATVLEGDDLFFDFFDLGLFRFRAALRWSSSLSSSDAPFGRFFFLFLGRTTVSLANLSASTSLQYSASVFAIALVGDVNKFDTPFYEEGCQYRDKQHKPSVYEEVCPVSTSRCLHRQHHTGLE